MNWRGEFKRKLILSLLIIIVPFISFSHLFFSDSDKQIDFFNFTFSHGYESNQLFVWMVLVDLSYILLICLTFLTINMYWRLFLTPILIYYLLSLYSILFHVLVLDLINSLEGIIVVSFGLILISILQYSSNDKSRIQKRTLQSSLSSSSIEYTWFKNWNQKVSKFKNKADLGENLKTDLCELYYLTSLVDERTNIRNINSEVNYLKRVGKFKFWRNGMIILLISALPFTHNFISYEPQSIQFMGYTWEAFGFNNWETFVWYTSRKLCIILLLISCFSWNRSWLRNAYLPAIALYSYQLIESFQDIRDFESNGNTTILPTVLFLIALFVIIMQREKVKSIILDNLDFLNQKYNSLLNNLVKNNNG